MKRTPYSARFHISPVYMILDSLVNIMLANVQGILFNRTSIFILLTLELGDRGFPNRESSDKMVSDTMNPQLRCNWRLIHMKYIARMSETIFMCSTWELLVHLSCNFYEVQMKFTLSSNHSKFIWISYVLPANYLWASCQLVCIKWV